MICRFGGNGSVLNIHEHSSSDHTYNVTSGLMRDEAVDLFRQFYNGENERGETRNVCRRYVPHKRRPVYSLVAFNCSNKCIFLSS